MFRNNKYKIFPSVEKIMVNLKTSDLVKYFHKERRGTFFYHRKEDI